VVKNIVIVGLGPGGIFAAKWASLIDKKAHITIIERRRYATYSPCSLPYAIGGQIELDRLVHPFPPTSRTDVYLHHEVIRIVPKKKAIVVKSLENNKRKEISYDALILALGEKPVIPDVMGLKKFLGKGVFTLKTMEDAENIIRFLKKCKKALVVGGGAIGLEVGFALREQNMEVSVVEESPHLVPNTLDEEMAKIVEAHLKERGINVFLNSKLEQIIGNEKIEGAIVDGNEIKTDLIFLAAGAKPNLELVRDVLKTDERGIAVNENMKTSVPNIYAVGDCVNIFSSSLDKKRPAQVATQAMKQGMVAGINAAGGSAKYTGSKSTVVNVIGGLEVAATGTNTPSENCIFAKVRNLNKPEWFGGENITLKVMIEKGSMKVLGAQAVGKDAASKINIIAFAVENGANVMELSALEQTYCCKISQMYDIINMTADVALRKMGKGITEYII
jgi:NADPH-dependent 2,4-dienoyl-CoA reductase/sulfur reductase-like enzyme